MDLEVVKIRLTKLSKLQYTRKPDLSIKTARMFGMGNPLQYSSDTRFVEPMRGAKHYVFRNSTSPQDCHCLPASFQAISRKLPCQDLMMPDSA